MKNSYKDSKQFSSIAVLQAPAMDAPQAAAETTSKRREGAKKQIKGDARPQRKKPKDPQRDFKSQQKASAISGRTNSDAVATPKKGAMQLNDGNYAGPDFHHSPAPANLPLPTFQSRSAPTSDSFSLFPKKEGTNTNNESEAAGIPVRSTASVTSALMPGREGHQGAIRHCATHQSQLGCEVSRTPTISTEPPLENHDGLFPMDSESSPTARSAGHYTPIRAYATGRPNAHPSGEFAKAASNTPPSDTPLSSRTAQPFGTVRCHPPPCPHSRQLLVPSNQLPSSSDSTGDPRVPKALEASNARLVASRTPENSARKDAMTQMLNLRL